MFRTSTSLAFGADFEDVPGGALVFVLPRRGARGYFTGPFAPRLGGCLERFACLHAQHPLLSEENLKMSHAGAGFHTPKGEAPGEALACSRPVCGDASGGLFVLWPRPPRLESKMRGCLRRGAGFSILKGSHTGVLYGPARSKVVGMSQAVCVFGCSDTFARKAD